MWNAEAFRPATLSLSGFGTNSIRRHGLHSRDGRYRGSSPLDDKVVTRNFGRGRLRGGGYHNVCGCSGRECFGSRNRHRRVRRGHGRHVDRRRIGGRPRRAETLGGRRGRNGHRGGLRRRLLCRIRRDGLGGRPRSSRRRRRRTRRGPTTIIRIITIPDKLHIQASTLSTRYGNLTRLTNYTCHLTKTTKNNSQTTRVGLVGQFIKGGMEHLCASNDCLGITAVGTWLNRS